MKFENRKPKEMELIKPNGCIVSKSVYDKEEKLRWLFKDIAVNETDSGWRAFGPPGDKNLIITDLDTLINIEPLFEKVKDYPEGTDLAILEDEAGKYFVETNTGKRLWF